MKTEIIPTREIMNELNLSQWTAQLMMKATGLSVFNDIYTVLSDYEGIELIEETLKLLNIEVDINENELKNIPKNGPFITVSNHPYGLLDGIILIKVLQKIRPDFQVTANVLLEKMEPFRKLFISVDPFKKKSLNGFQKVLSRLEEGHCIGLFPAAEVSTYHNTHKTITDKPWSKSSIKLIQSANVPVIPIYFHGANSWSFHLLGKIHPLLRTFQLPNEFLKKRNQTIKVRIGQEIPVSKLQQFDQINDLRQYLRNKTYLLGEGMKQQRFLKPNKSVKDNVEPIIPQIPNSIIQDEIDQLPSSSVLCEHGHYEVRIAPADKIPYTLLEIGRLREITYRDVGEGTNREIDLDKFDEYYHHLFIWEKYTQKIIGAYRIGMGDEIIKHLGKKGFYTHTLFKFKDEFTHVLANGIELGRSFIIKEKQKDAFPLFILWKGINLLLKRNQQYKYMFGPVSISNDYSDAAKDAIIYYSYKYLFDEEVAQFVKARQRYKIKDHMKKYIDNLISGEKITIDELDKLIMDIEPKKYRVPVLIRQYIKLNGRLIGFNIDPKFNHCIDGLILVNVDNIPKKITNQLT
ncbi:GNAT family N-acyltransferase [Flammeovirga sp. SubArs3]|uniref:lysophospholipid acyltransferase family protein n=1 Tax=Flammeovirga sp. SubArs3 TaxID=2995316 RepID=UPI00248B4BDC|nr:GNAT family N-acyltransferase [Flammeovirga sp. SubArs3]